MNASDHASDFLHHIFPPPKQELGEAFIEVRVLGDAQKGQFYDQRWYQSTDELLDDLDSLHELARENKACVAFSPALRKKREGTRDAVLGASCVWNDQPTFTCSKQECIQRLQGGDFSLEIVDSGNSAHGYILLEEFSDDIQKIEHANRLLKQRYEGDHVHDAGRVMRIPGALNYKNPTDPQLCKVVQFADKRYHIDEVIHALEQQVRTEVLDDCDGQLALLPADTRIAVQHDPLLQKLPVETISMVFEAFPVGERSEHDLAIVPSGGE